MANQASVEKNARELKEYIEEIYWGSQKRVMLLGHSKGGVDAAAALSLHWSDLKDKVAGLALAQSPYGGSPIASDILREGQLGDYVNIRRLMEIIICKVIKVLGISFFFFLSILLVTHACAWKVTQHTTHTHTHKLVCVFFTYL